MNEEKYAERCSQRIQSVVEYVKGDAFYIHVCVGALSAIPRWRFARVLEVRSDEGITPRLGNALQDFYKSTSEITCGSNALTEHIVNRDPSAGTLRLLLNASLMRAYLYLVEKNDHYLGLSRNEA